MIGTVSVQSSNRQARHSRQRQFESLAEFANMGDKQEAWYSFRLKQPNFFPPEVSTWIYTDADDWLKSDSSVRRFAKPSLLWYRDLLRNVWARNDRYGTNLAILLGFERPNWIGNILVEQASASGKETLSGKIRTIDGQLCVVPDDVPAPVFRRAMAQDESRDGQLETMGGLPQGRPVVEGNTGEILWKFGCILQQAVYDLMQTRWRAKICPICGSYFVAEKTARKLCSTRCTGEQLIKRSLKYYFSKGKAKRQERQKREKNRAPLRNKK